MTSLLIGNIVTSVLSNHATRLQLALGVLINRKKMIKHMFDYKVTCSYDALRRYKKSSAVARYTKLRREERVHVAVSGLIQHIADHFDADPNRKVSTHLLAMSASPSHFIVHVSSKTKRRNQSTTMTTRMS